MLITLFVTFLVIFIATAVITLLGITQRIAVPREYLKPLFAALILEVVGTVIALFSSGNFLGESAQQFVKQLPREVQAEPAATNGGEPNLEQTRQKIAEAIQHLHAQEQEVRVLQDSLAKSQAILTRYNELRGHVLLMFAQLNLDVARSRGDFINLDFKPEEKVGIAKRIYEAMAAIGALPPNTGQSPKEVRAALVEYQTRKKFANATGNFGKGTLISMIEDYLANIRSYGTASH